MVAPVPQMPLILEGQTLVTAMQSGITRRGGDNGGVRPTDALQWCEVPTSEGKSGSLCG